MSAKMHARAYLIVNLANNSVVAEKNSAKVYPIASITKLMNAVVFLEYENPSRTITITSAMLKPMGHSPVLYPGLQISGQNLLKVALIQSCNDAANALSYFTGSKQYIALMNQKAKSLGMTRTYFADAYGLSPSNRSSAQDLVKLVSYIYQTHPEILSITKEDNFQLPDQQGDMLKLKNVNDLYANPDFLGAKAGYIVESKQTLASVAEVNGTPMAIVLLHSTNRMADALNIVNWIKDKSA